MQASDIIRVFNDCFEQSHATVLVGGADEPLYQPGESGEHHQVIFRSDYASSALHEAAHWCIAGAARRQQVDYGYWYKHERDLEAQQAFEQAELKPQGLEWVFSVASGVPFRVSCDNFDPSTLNLPAFRTGVQANSRQWLQRMPDRAAQFIHAMIHITGNTQAMNPCAYKDLPK